MSRMITALSAIGMVAAGLAVGPAEAAAQNFDYKPAGDLVAGSGQGRQDTKIYVPGMRFPIEDSPAYANSQVYGHGGYQGPGGGQCHSDNYSYPWWDNYCEHRSWDMPLCPAGDGHQGQDIRPSTCKDSAHWTVAAEDGTITHVGTYSVYLTTASGRIHRYLHMNHSRLAVSEGDTVQKGDRLGLVSDNMGDTPTTIHLHYDIKDYVQGVGKVYVPTYMSLVDSYKRLLGQGGVGDRYSADLEVAWSNGKDRYPTGSSKDLPDFFHGETVEATLLIKNTSKVVWRDVWLGYAFESPWLTPTDYRIESDHPAHDQSSWKINDADMADANPPKDQMGANGKLNLYALSPGESKRITVTLRAGPYSIGAVDHPDARAWLWRVEGAYGDQTGFRKKPGTNKFGENVRDYAQLDVLSRDHWHFAGDTEDELEGWSGEGDSGATMRNKEDDLLAQKTTGGDVQLESPAWTRVDANKWDEMVLRVRSHDGVHDKAVFWSGPDESASGNRVVRFEAAGDSEMNTYVVPIDEHDGWRGTVEKLRVDLLDGEAPGEEALGWYGLADLFFQNSQTRKTNSGRESYVDRPPVELGGTETDPQPDTGEREGPDTGFGTGYDAGGSESDTGSASGPRRNAIDETTTTSSCSTTGGRTPPVSLLVLAIVVIGFRQRNVSDRRTSI